MGTFLKPLMAGYGRFLHGGDYNPDQWLHRPEILDRDFELMREAGCNTLSIGIFAWSALEPEEGHFQFDWLDNIFDRIEREGFRAILATPSGARPAWMAHKYPEVLRVSKLGLRNFYEGRHNHCWSSTVYREKVSQINELLANRYGQHPVLGMWHLSNEYSGHCYCSSCLKWWASWLEEKFVTFDAMNLAYWSSFWSHRYCDWNQVDPRDDSVDGMRLDWMRFLTAQCCDFTELEKKPFKRACPDIPITTNFMGLFEGLDYSKIAKHLDLICDDQYPRFDPENDEFHRSGISTAFKDDLYRCFKPDRAWMLMESCPDSPQWKTPMRLKRPQVHRLEMLQAVAHGAEGTCYFQWRKGRGSHEKLHGAVVDHVGHGNTRVFRDVAEWGRSLISYQEILGSRISNEIGVLFDWDSRWGFNLTSGTDSDNYWYERVAHDHYQAVMELGYGVDVVTPDSDFRSLRFLIAPTLWCLSEDLAKKLSTFVENGGVLIATPYFGWADEFNRIHFGGLPGLGMTEVFGVWNEETDGPSLLTPRIVMPKEGNSLGISSALSAPGVASILHVSTAEVLATYGSDFYAGSAAITLNSFGNGEAVFFGPQMDVESLRTCYSALLAKTVVSKVVEGDFPVTLHRKMRRSETTEFLFLLNFSPDDVAVSLQDLGWVDVESNQHLDNVMLQGCESVVLKRPLN